MIVVDLILIGYFVEMVFVLGKGCLLLMIVDFDLLIQIKQIFNRISIRIDYFVTMIG